MTISSYLCCSQIYCLPKHLTERTSDAFKAMQCHFNYITHLTVSLAPESLGNEYTSQKPMAIANVKAGSGIQHT